MLFLCEDYHQIATTTILNVTRVCLVSSPRKMQVKCPKTLKVGRSSFLEMTPNMHVVVDLEGGGWWFSSSVIKHADKNLVLTLPWQASEIECAKIGQCPCTLANKTGMGWLFCLLRFHVGACTDMKTLVA